MISGLITYALTCGTNSELHDKEVTLTTSDITGSQTAVFEYDPQNEPVSGTPPGPWDGYSLFTIDLSGVKTDIEGYLAQIAALEDALEDCHDCRDAVVAALQEYDPDYDPDEGECPADKVTEVVDKVEELEEQVEECDQCKADVIAKLQEYDPTFDPQTCDDIPTEIDNIAGYEFPVGTPYPDIVDICGADPVYDNDTHTAAAIKVYKNHMNRWMVGEGYIENGEFVQIHGEDYGESPSYIPVAISAKVVDSTTGRTEYKYSYGTSTYTYYYSSRALIGVGDPSHTYHVSNKTVS